MYNAYSLWAYKETETELDTRDGSFQEVIDFRF